MVVDPSNARCAGHSIQSAWPAQGVRSRRREVQVRRGGGLHAGVLLGGVTIALATALAVGGAARAAEECGPAPPGMAIECTPANYDAAAGGNIFYGPGVPDGDFSIRLVDRLAVAYDRGNPDDELQLGDFVPTGLYQYSLNDFDPTGRYRYGAVVVIAGDSTHTGDIAVSSSADMASAGADAHGYLIGHIGASGRVRLDLEGGSITTNGGGAAGILGFHGSEGDIDAAMRGTAIRVEGDDGAGVWLRHTGTGDIGFRAVGGGIDAVGARARGVSSTHFGTGSSTVDLRDVAVSASGDGGRGVWVRHVGTGDIGIVAKGGNIGVVAKGGSTAAVVNGARAMNFNHFGTGDIVVDVEGVDIAAAADAGIPIGIAAIHLGSGDIAISAEGGRIEATGDRNISYGVYGAYESSAEGDMAVDLRNVVVTAEGEQASGVYLVHLGTSGSLSIHLRDTTVTAAGDATGIRALLRSGEGSIRIRLDGGSVDTGDPGGDAIFVGLLDAETGAVEFAAELGADGYRRQSVVVNGRVRGGSGDGSGIRVAGGGRVEIGPRGSVGAASGVAVRALGDGAALHVGADFDGRRAGEVIGGSIRNDDGRTTIAVNGVTLHDGMAGATGLWAPNGARDVTLVAAYAVAGRGFSAADFVTGPYAPRAAVYEALPGFLLRLDGAGAAAGERLHKTGSPAWVRVSGGRGSYGSGRASVGASYDFDRFGVEAGLDVALSVAGDVTGSVSVRHVRGSADITAPTGGGRIAAEGLGAALGATWRGDAGYYVNGRVSVTRYKADLRSAGRGRLKSDAGATVRSLGLEAGRRLALGETMHLTPRAWLVRSDMSLSGFRDAVGSHVSLAEGARTAAGLGVVAGTVLSWDGGERTFSLRGEIGVERSLGDTEMAVDVSGERLRSATGSTRAVLGIGGVYRLGRSSLGGEVTASGPGSDDSSFTGSFRFAMRF